MANTWLAKLTLDQRRKYNHDQHIRLTIAAKSRKCFICGGLFKSRRKKVKTCSPRCRAYLIGLSEIRLTKEQLVKVQAKRAVHPRTGPFTTHCQAKYWSLIGPNGSVYQFWNLSYFVRENIPLFNSEDVVMDRYNTLAAHQLRRLRPDRRNPINSWKGWKWHYVYTAKAKATKQGIELPK